MAASPAWRSASLLPAQGFAPGSWARTFTAGFVMLAQNLAKFDYLNRKDIQMPTTSFKFVLKRPHGSEDSKLNHSGHV